MNEQEIVTFNQENVYCAKSTRGYGMTYLAKKDFRCGTVIMHGFGKTIDHQTSHFSVQVDFGKHFLPKKWTGKYWNHSCEPNTFIKTQPDGFPDLIALRAIKSHEEITYGYYMTEYVWSKGAKENAIQCYCGAGSCAGRIRSFSQLTPQEQLNLVRESQLSDYLVELVKRSIVR
jgi:hypothetical protein